MNRHRAGPLNCARAHEIRESESRKSVFEAAGTALETVFRLLPDPPDDALIVVAIAEVVVEGGEAVLLACLLHVLELVDVEVPAVDVAPVIARGVHGEAGRDGAVG